MKKKSFIKIHFPTSVNNRKITVMKIIKWKFLIVVIYLVRDKVQWNYNNENYKMKILYYSYLPSSGIYEMKLQ